MPVQQPYFNKHQIQGGKYATIGQFVIDSGEDFEGLYHTTPEGRNFTGALPSQQDKELFIKRVDLSNDVRTYRKVKQVKQQTLINKAPQPHNLIVTSQDYQLGYVTRYFAQNRTQPNNTIIEISSDQAKSVGSGISLSVYNIITITWYISKFSREDIANINRSELSKAEKTFPGISQYLINLAEYYK